MKDQESNRIGGKTSYSQGAVERRPHKFIGDYALAGMGVITQGAIFRDGQWEPILNVGSIPTRAANRGPTIAWAN